MDWLWDVERRVGRVVNDGVNDGKDLSLQMVVSMLEELDWRFESVGWVKFGRFKERVGRRLSC